jgi:hypothetical protein
MGQKCNWNKSANILQLRTKSVGIHLNLDEVHAIYDAPVEKDKDIFMSP